MTGDLDPTDHSDSDRRDVPSDPPVHIAVGGAVREYLALLLKSWLPPGLVILAIVSGLLDLDVFVPAGIVLLVVFIGTLLHFAWRKSMGWRVDSRQLERQVAKTRMAIERTTRLQNELDLAQRRIEDLQTQLPVEREAAWGDGVAAAYGGLAALACPPPVIVRGRVHEAALVVSARIDANGPVVGSRYSAILGDPDDGDVKGILEVVDVQGERATLRCVVEQVPQYWDEIKRLVMTEPTAANGLTLVPQVPELHISRSVLVDRMRALAQAQAPSR